MFNLQYFALITGHMVITAITKNKSLPVQPVRQVLAYCMFKTIMLYLFHFNISYTQSRTRCLWLQFL